MDDFCCDHAETKFSPTCQTVSLTYIEGWDLQYSRGKYNPAHSRIITTVSGIILFQTVSPALERTIEWEIPMLGGTSLRDDIYTYRLSGSRTFQIMANLNSDSIHSTGLCRHFVKGSCYS